MNRNNRWFRISLRTLLIFLTSFAVVLGWFGHYVQQRKAAFAAIERVGGKIQLELHEPSLFEQWLGPELGPVLAVDMRNTQTDNELLDQIAVLSEVQRLDLSSADIDDDGLRKLVHLPLRVLWLQGTNITDASAATISHFKKLDHLPLNATALTDAFLEHLEPLPILRNVGLRGTHVTSVGMEYLSRHPELTKLDVYLTEVDDAGVERLVACRSLTALGLSMTKITPRVFEHLAKFANLTKVDLSGNQSITTKAVLEFEKSHPKCDIEWYGN